MSAPPRLLLPSLVACALTPLAGCHAAGCRDGDLVCAALTDAATDDPTTGPGPTTEVVEPTSTTTETPSTETTAPPATCGDGVVDPGEDCDDGNDDDTDACLSTCREPPSPCGDGQLQPALEQCDDGNDDNTDSCVGDCKFASCGDGFVRAGIEACDDGPENSDLAYEGCTSKCQPGPFCGDGKINGPEGCDDQNEEIGDGCLTGCVEATSCLQIKQLVPEAPSGAYRIWPAALDGDIDVVVWCDMEADGGGYTFLKVDTQIGDASDKGAAQAELVCQTYGMHLLVPRSPAHVLSAFNVATTANAPVVGGGMIATGLDYLAILAIYPAMKGSTCEGGALNSESCPGWMAWDRQRYWVTDTPVPGEPDPDNCVGCSMLYKWNLDGTVKSYIAFSAGEGAGSYRFICDVADKIPR